MPPVAFRGLHVYLIVRPHRAPAFCDVNWPCVLLGGWCATGHGQLAMLLNASYNCIHGHSYAIFYVVPPGMAAHSIQVYSPLPHPARSSCPCRSAGQGTAIEQPYSLCRGSLPAESPARRQRRCRNAGWVRTCGQTCHNSEKINQSITEGQLTMCFTQPLRQGSASSTRLPLSALQTLRKPSLGPSLGLASACIILTAIISVPFRFLVTHPRGLGFLFLSRQLDHLGKPAFRCGVVVGRSY